jgi:hypothetical protein
MSRGIPQGHQRGQETAADAVANQEGEGVAEPIDPPQEPPLRTPGFARMRLDWSSQDRPIIQRAKSAVEGRILTEFADAFEIMNEVYEVVRSPEVDPATGEIKRDMHGFVVWARTPSGRYDEDFNRLSKSQREHFMFLITGRIFDWEQRAADIRMEAMLARGQFEERFAIGFDAPVTGTVDDRRAAGNLDARDERYFAIFAAALSHRADAVVRAMTELERRLRDSLYGTR